MSIDSLATLGLGVDSTPVQRATTELQTFAQSARGAEQAAQSFGRGTQQATNAAQQMAQAVNRAVNSAEAINQRLNVKDSFGGADRAADIAAYMKSIDDLQAKYAPLRAAGTRYAATIDEINMAARVGAITETERAAAVMRADAAHKTVTASILQTTRAINETSKAGGLASYQMTNLAFQINDVATMAAMGADPLRILASQGGQLYQILAQGEGGVTGSLRGLGSTLAGLITPARVVTGLLITGFGGLALTLAAAVANQEQMRLSLIGVASAAGITEGSITRIASAAAAAGKLTVGDAQQIALALASTGKISEDIAARATMAAQGLSKIFGETAVEAGARLAKALADPIKGVDDLNARLGTFDDRTAQMIRQLAASNQTLAAQRLLIDNVSNSTKLAEQATSGWTNAWQRLTAATSEYWAAFRDGSARVAGLAPLEQRLADEQKRLAELQALQASPRPRTNVLGLANAIERQTEKVRELSAALAALRENEEKVKGAQDSAKLGDAIRATVPDLSTLAGLRAEYEKMYALSRDPKTLAGVDDATLQSLDRALTIRQMLVELHKSEFEIAREQAALDVRMIQARSPRERAQIEYERAREQAARSGRYTGDEADTIGQMARMRTLIQANEDLRRSQEQQILAARQRTDMAATELSLVGQNAETQDRIRAQKELQNQAEQEALRLYGSKDAYDRAHLAALQAQAAQQARINQLARERAMMQDLQFERDQMGRTAMENEVYQRLRSAGMLTNGEIQGASAEAAAAQIRLNYTIRESISMSKDFASSFVRDMMAGKSASEALAGSLDRLAQRLMDLALDNAFSAILGGGGGTNALSGLLGGGLKPGGSANVPTFHTGGVVGVNDNNPRRLISTSAFAGAPRYHGGGIAGLRPGEVPAILQRGEVVLPVGAGIAGGGINISMPLTIDARGAYPESIAEIKQAIAQQAADLPRQVVRVVRQAQDRKVI